MRVLIINTSENTGGAAVAANRLVDALNNNGVKAKMLVRDKATSRVTVSGVGQKLRSRWAFLWERWCIFWHLHFTREHLFEIDIANAGVDVTHLREFKEADVIHLSWINQGMLSLSGLRKILASGKPVVWTMHDLWPASSICHYAHGCPKFHSNCNHCKLLPGGGGKNDLSSKVWKKKAAILKNHTIWFVACSHWLETQAKESRLLSGQPVTSIPNPINTKIFAPTDQKQARLSVGLPQDRQILLFVSQRVTDTRKGVGYFVEAIQRLVASRPELKQRWAVALLGGHAEELADSLPLDTYPLGYVSDERQIVGVYNSADVFVLPSLEDNLPNTLMEAMACGVPCVGFRVGGIPEMIDHQKNGYVAKLRDVADLANGIAWTLDADRHSALSEAALAKVHRCYSQRAVSLKYIDVYNEAMAYKNYKL